MCIAIMKSANKKINKTTLRRCYTANPDGAGFMFAEDNELHVKKGYFTFDEFYCMHFTIIRLYYFLYCLLRKFIIYHHAIVSLYSKIFPSFL